MAAVEVKIQGAEELEKMLLALPKRLRVKHLRRAIRRGISLTRDDIKANAPVRSTGDVAYRKGARRPKPGRLRRLVRIKARRGKRGYLKVSLFYPVEGAGNNPKNAFYHRFVRDGTRNMRGNDYVMRSADTTFPRVVAIVIAETNTGVREELAKLTGKP